MISVQPFYARGLNFSCRRCSACCRFDPGFVFLRKADIDALITAVAMEEDAFIRTYCRWVPGFFDSNSPESPAQELLSLKEKSGFDCIFWKNGCTVYEKRPLQCRTFPFWESIVHSSVSWNELMRDCPGMGKGRAYSRAEIEIMLARSSSEPIITRTV
ncbi:MAG: YkgJ family cysteine cluster protein [Spirochaetaceae bacterium]|jgi:Fe-S-cluster containining protein|nr:YkgJ family cysteine cluster protein [Spirochaetaceae bacterium]